MFSESNLNVSCKNVKNKVFVSLKPCFLVEREGKVHIISFIHKPFSMCGKLAESTDGEGNCNCINLYTYTLKEVQ